MRLREAAASALQFLAVLFFLLLSAFWIMLPLRPDWRMTGIEWLQESPGNFYWIGAAAGAAGLLFLLGFFFLGRGRFLRLSMKPNPVTVDVKIIEKTIEDCFQANCPMPILGVDIIALSHKRLEIAIDCEPIESKRQVQLMEEMEKKLILLLRERFGYTRAFTISIRSK